MKATIGIELIGDNEMQFFRLYESVFDQALFQGAGKALIGRPKSSSWVAEITGTHPKYGLNRKFLGYKKDYSKSNSSGSRGVYAWYILESGKCYEVSRKLTWSSLDRFFARVTEDGGIERIEKSEVMEWLRSQSE